MQHGHILDLVSTRCLPCPAQSFPPMLTLSIMEETASDPHPSSRSTHSCACSDVISVQNLLDMRFPAFDPPSLAPAAFRLSSSWPVVDSSEIHARPIPPSADIMATLSMAMISLQQYNRPHRYNSFLDSRFQNIPTPISTLGHWLRLHEDLEARRQWAAALTWVREHDDEESAQARGLLRREVEESFTQVSASLCGALNCVRIDPTCLRELLDDAPLPRETFEVLLDVVRQRLNADVDKQPLFHVCTIAPATWLSMAPTERWDQYGIDTGVGEARALAASWASRQPPLHACFMPWYHDGHWVLYVVDFSKREIRYADPCGCPPANETVVIFRQWLGRDMWAGCRVHAQDCGGPDDGYSCGLILVNAIEHAIFGDALWTTSIRAQHRVQKYLALVQYRYSIQASTTDKLSSIRSGD